MIKEKIKNIMKHLLIMISIILGSVINVYVLNLSLHDSVVLFIGIVEGYWSAILINYLYDRR